MRNTNPVHSFSEVWDTHFVAPRDRFAFFRESVCQAFLAVSPEKPEGGDIAARVERATLSRGWFGKIDVTPHDLRRTSADKAKIPDTLLSLNLQLKGACHSVLGQKKVGSGSSDLYIFRSIEVDSVEIDRSERLQLLSIIFDQSLLGNSLKPDQLGPLTFMGEQFGPLKSCLQLIETRYQSATEDELTHLFDATISLLCSLLIRDPDYLDEICDRSGSGQSGVLETIKFFMRHDIANPDQSLKTIATRFRISIRSLQNLFAYDGITFNNYLTLLRLNQIKVDIQNPTHAHVPIGDIAFRWGYRDMTTLHRNFKSHFGETPGQMRGTKE